MTATGKWYGLGMSAVMNAAVDWDSDTIKAGLATVSWTPNQDTDDFRNDVTAELSASGYTAGGVTLSSLTRTYDAATNEIRLDAADLLWTGLSGTFRYIYIYKSRGGASSADELIGYVDLGADTSPGGGNFAVQWDTTGVLKVTVS